MYYEISAAHENGFEVLVSNSAAIYSARLKLTIGTSL